MSLKQIGEREVPSRLPPVAISRRTRAERIWRVSSTATYVSGYCLFVLMLFAPTTYQPLKVMLLAPIVAAVAVRLSKMRLRPPVHWKIVAWTAMYVTIGIAFIALGSQNGATQAYRLATVYVLWPILFTSFLAVIDDHVLKRLDTIMVASTVAVSAYALVYVLVEAGLVPEWLFVDFHQEQRIGIYAGFTQLHLASLSSLLFLLPYQLAYLVTGATTSRARRVGGWIALGLGLIVAAASLRRALITVVVLSPVIIIAFVLFLPRKRLVESAHALGGVTVALCTVTLIATLLTMSSIGFRPDNWVREFSWGFDLTTTSAPTPDNLSSAPAAEDLPGPQARTSQFSALVSGWLEHPIFGAGHGTSARVIRSNEQPYAYELSYLALLFHTGLVGFLLYASGVIWIFYSGVRLIQSGDELARRGLPVYVGTACFLIANATNPYLEKFDYMWVIFLPLAFINVRLLRPSGGALNPGPLDEQHLGRPKPRNGRPTAPPA